MRTPTHTNIYTHMHHRDRLHREANNVFLFCLFYSPQLTIKQNPAWKAKQHHYTVIIINEKGAEDNKWKPKGWWLFMCAMQEINKKN